MRTKDEGKTAGAPGFSLESTDRSVIVAGARFRYAEGRRRTPATSIPPAGHRTGKGPGLVWENRFRESGQPISASHDFSRAYEAFAARFGDIGGFKGKTEGEKVVGVQGFEPR